MDAKKTGEAIRKLRNRIGYTQRDLAATLGVTDKAVSKWERGLSVHDIAIITELSLVLNCDVDNLLEGNITFLEKSWQGLLVLKENPNHIFSGTLIYGKPMVYFLLSYFMLAGVRHINILCPERDKKFIRECIADGSEYGLSVNFIGDLSELKRGNTMVVYDEPFLYGSNLTKYFQRAMSKENKISALTVYKGKGGNKCCADFNNLKVLRLNDEGNCYCIPICFVPVNRFEDLNCVFNYETLVERNQLYAEPMGNGMIEYSIKTKEDVFQTAFFIRYLENMMGYKIYEIAEIAKNRNLI